MPIRKTIFEKRMRIKFKKMSKFRNNLNLAQKQIEIYEKL